MATSSSTPPIDASVAKLPGDDRWSEIELLPEWDEPYYDIYTAKKLGKWVMLKTLKPKFKDDPRFQGMIEKEFDVRYNLAHPGIVMINDFEDVPGLGRCIITDDVYGLPLRKVIDSGKLNESHLEKICTQLVDAIDYIQRNHIVHFPIRPETIIFTENVENLKLIDVGFDQREHLLPAEASEDIESFGRVLNEVLDHLPNPPSSLRRIADRCMSRPYKSVHQLRMAIAHRRDRNLFLLIALFIVVVTALLLWLSSALAPGIPGTPS